MMNFNDLEIVLMSLSGMVFLLIFSKMVFSNYFNSKFIFLMFLLFFMIVFNLVCLLSFNCAYLCLILIYLSFYSMYLVMIGYGSGVEALGVMFFKMLADLFIILFMGFNLLFNCDYKLFMLDCLLEFEMVYEVFLIISFLIYSLLGVFGFWMYWAMDASYFISCYLHSCGFVSVGVIVFGKLSHLGVIVKYEMLTHFVVCVSFISFLIFMILFISVSDLKKAFGFFSSSSICYIFLLTMLSPTQSVIYFYVSSMTKVLFFELMSYLSKLDFNSDFKILFLLVIIFLSNLPGCLMLMFILDNFYKFFMVDIVLLMFHIKIFSIFLFLIKMLYYCEFCFISMSLLGFVFVVASNSGFLFMLLLTDKFEYGMSVLYMVFTLIYILFSNLFCLIMGSLEGFYSGVFKAILFLINKFLSIISIEISNMNFFNLFYLKFYCLDTFYIFILGLLFFFMLILFLM